MRSDDLGIQLLFIPEEYGGMGGGNIHHPEVGAWLRESAARGAVAIGGAPWNADDPAAATRAAADLVAGTGLGLDLHMDETDDPSVCTLPALPPPSKTPARAAGRSPATAAASPGSPSRSPAVKRSSSPRRAWRSSCAPSATFSLQGRQMGGGGVAPVRVLRKALVTVGIVSTTCATWSSPWVRRIRGGPPGSCPSSAT